LSRFFIPDEVIDFFFNLPNPCSRTMSLWSSHSLTEMSTRNLPRGKAGPAHKADSLAASVSWLSRQCWLLGISQPYRPPRPVKERALLFLCLGMIPNLYVLNFQTKTNS
jgi:hypothetical protein